MKKNKIILINPGIRHQDILSYGIYPNTAVMVLSTILHNAGFCVRIIDGKYKKIDDCVNDISNEADESLIFIGFSVMTIQVPWAYYVSKAVKRLHPKVKIVWGGVHATLFPYQTAEDEAVDVVVSNDAAETIVPLSSALADGDDLSGVPGIFYREGAKIINTPPSLQKDSFDNIPFIDFSLIGHNRYSKNNNAAIEEFYGGKYKDSTVYPVITGLGCSYRCTFCINVILKKKYCCRSARDIIERIKYLKHNYGADFIQPMDENFFINKKRTFEFLDLLEKENLNIKWRPQTRADYFRNDYINLDTARRMDRAGMTIAAIGVESASQETLDRLNKNLKVEDIIHAMEIISRTNIIPKMNFMVGLPGETEEDIRKTYKLAVRLRRMAKKSCIMVSPFRPYPGSPLYNQIVSEYGYSPPTNLGDWAKLSEREFAESIGYESFEGYKWIENPKKLKVMQYVYRQIAWYMPWKDRKLWGKIINGISFLRFRLDCFCLVWLEKALFEGLRKVKHAVRGILNK